MFSLTKGEQGETDLLEMLIDIGNAISTKQAARRIPFAVRQEVAQQLKSVLQNQVIQPSHCPWASLIVIVKKDGTLKCYVDYRVLNSVTKSNQFPLPRINDMLNQLRNIQYF